MAGLDLVVGNSYYSTEFKKSGWFQLVEVKEKSVVGILEDYDNAKAEIPLNMVKESPDSEFNAWFDGLDDDGKNFALYGVSR